LVIQLYRKIIETLAPDVLIITETNVPHKDNISYFGNGHNEAHMVYNFTLPPLLAFSLISGNVSKLAKWLSHLELPNNDSCYFNFTASHDGVGLQPVKDILTKEEINLFEIQTKKNNGFISYKTNSDGTKSPYELNCTYLNLVSTPLDSTALKAKKFLLTQAVMLTIPGIPGIYIHSLLGTENDLKAAEVSGIPRRINRSRLDIDEVILELNKEGTIRNIIFGKYKELLKVRISNSFFDPHLPFDIHLFNDQVFAIHKQKGGNEFWAIFNFSGSSQIVTLADSKILWDIIENNTIASDKIILEPFGFYWIKCDITN